MDFNRLAKSIHENAKAKGWWEQPRAISELLQLCISEISEATECVRDGEPDIHFGKLGCEMSAEFAMKKNWDLCPKGLYMLSPCEELEMLKPEGEAVELADCAIRLLDIAGAYSMDVDPGRRYLDHINFDSSDFESPLTIHYTIIKSLCCEFTIQKVVNGSLFLIQQYFEAKGWDFEDVMELKNEYNKIRAFRHGGKKF